PGYLLLQRAQAVVLRNKSKREETAPDRPANNSVNGVVFLWVPVGDAPPDGCGGHTPGSERDPVLTCSRHHHLRAGRRWYANAQIVVFAGYARCATEFPSPTSR